MAIDRSTELKLLADNSLSADFSFLPFRNGPPLFLIRFCDRCSPQRFEPPWVYGIFRRAIPCSCGPFANSSETPSHWNGDETKSNTWDETWEVKSHPAHSPLCLNSRANFYRKPQMSRKWRIQSTRVCSSCDCWICADSSHVPDGISHKWRRPGITRNH